MTGAAHTPVPLAMIRVIFATGVERIDRASTFNFDPCQGGPIVRRWEYLETPNG